MAGGKHTHNALQRTKETYNHWYLPGSETSLPLIPLMPEVLIHTNGCHMFYKIELVFLLETCYQQVQMVLPASPESFCEGTGPQTSLHPQREPHQPGRGRRPYLGLTACIEPGAPPSPPANAGHTCHLHVVFCPFIPRYTCVGSFCHQG